MEQQIPRNALVWIIICLFALIAPHAQRIPVWVLAVYLLAAVWRVLVYRGRWSFPGRWVKIALIASAFAGIWFSYRSLIGLEPTVALLLTAFALKLIELAERKDAYVLLFLGYFICLTEFLFSQDLLIVLYSLLNVVLITTALVALHQPGEHQFNRGTIRLAGTMVLQAMPLMVVLFFLFPRIGPLWTVPMKSHTAKTGVSDFMKPGDISRLTQSDDVAFRAQFEGDIPARSRLYWRGLVMSKLEEGAWRSLRYYDVPPAERRPAPVQRVGDRVSYSVIMEPTQQNWLYSLRYAQSTSSGVMSAPDFRLFTPVELEDQYRYEAYSWPDAALELELSDWRREVELRLPGETNPRTRQLAETLRAGVDSDAAMVDAVLARFRTDSFTYTLQPPLLTDDDPMDQFLFETRRGFCEHYAYAFVVMMRAAGIPARVVAGYQGGEVNPVNRTVIVHQFDAHAWAEVWLEGGGWKRVDPTASVSPDRIEWGLEQAVAAEGTFLAESPLSPLRFRGVNWVNQLRLRYDALTYRWQSWVVGFDSEQQFEFLQDLFGEVSARRFAMVLLGTWGVALGLIAINLLRKPHINRLTFLDRKYLGVCERLAGLGMARQTGESPRRFAARVAQARPDWGEPFLRISDMYCDLAYADKGDAGADDGERLAQFLRAVREFRPRGQLSAASVAPSRA
jgi:transglutaminase-like putative cysteine protease